MPEKTCYQTNYMSSTICLGPSALNFFQCELRRDADALTSENGVAVLLGTPSCQLAPTQKKKSVTNTLEGSKIPAGAKFNVDLVNS
jgi:hypothetical protein